MITTKNEQEVEAFLNLVICGCLVKIMTAPNYILKYH